MDQRRQIIEGLLNDVIVGAVRIHLPQIQVSFEDHDLLHKVMIASAAQNAMRDFQDLRNMGHNGGACKRGHKGLLSTELASPCSQESASRPRAITIIRVFSLAAASRSPAWSS